MISRKFQQMSKAYKHFALVWDMANQQVCTQQNISPIILDYSDKALEDMYNLETFGKGKLRPNNAFSIGKQQLNISLACWLEDMPKLLKPWELYLSFPRWFLTKVLPERYRLTENTLDWIKKTVDTSYW